MARRKYWGLIAPTMPARELAVIAAQQESTGLVGTFAPQVYGPPFAPLTAAAVTTEKLLLASGVAIALTRSPFETAMAAIDLDRLSEGRFVLGLGSSVRAWTEGIFGMPYGSPVRRLREVVEIIRLVVAKSHTGELGPYESESYTFDFSALQATQPSLREAIPIWVSALRSPMTRLGAEIGDGVIGHPIWSLDWLRTTVVEDLKQGLARAGRQRADIELNCWFWTTPHRDRRQSLEDARGVVAFYAGIAQYEPYFAAHGYGAASRRLQEALKRDGLARAARLVPDDMAERFVITGTPDTVRRKLEPAWAIADSLCLVPPVVALSPAATAAYFATIAETFYADG